MFKFLPFDSQFSRFSVSFLDSWFFLEGKFLILETPARFEAPIRSENRYDESSDCDFHDSRKFNSHNRCFEKCENQIEEIRIKILTEIKTVKFSPIIQKCFDSYQIGFFMWY